MSREASDELDEDGCIKNGFDYNLQAWVEDGIILRCGHRDKYHNEFGWCPAATYAGLWVRNIPGHEVRKENDR